MTLLDEVVQGVQRSDNANVGLQVVYPQRHFQPKHISEFIVFLKEFCQR